MELTPLGYTGFLGGLNHKEIKMAWFWIENGLICGNTEKVNNNAKWFDIDPVETYKLEIQNNEIIYKGVVWGENEKEIIKRCLIMIFRSYITLEDQINAKTGIYNPETNQQILNKVENFYSLLNDILTNPENYFNEADYKNIFIGNYEALKEKCHQLLKDEDII